WRDALSTVGARARGRMSRQGAREMSTVEEIARKLQRRMRSKGWRTAGRLPGQRELASEMGVSRASLREAIAMLESLGLLRSEPGRGVFIAGPGGEPGGVRSRGPWRFQQSPEGRRGGGGAEDVC